MLTNTYDVLGELESTWSQIRVMEYEYMDGVSFNHGGRNNLLRKSHGKCIRYMNTLCTLRLLNDWLLCNNWEVASSSSQIQRPCLDHVMKENRSPFMRSWLKLRTL